MNKIAVSLIMAVFFALLPAGTAGAEGSQTLTGEYVWNQRGSAGEIEAVFKPTGDTTWDVSFYFTFRGKDHVYSGTAEGSLSDGKLNGTVLNEDKKRTFKFTGTVTGGQFDGTHAEISKEGKEYDTGTLKLGV